MTSVAGALIGARTDLVRWTESLFAASMLNNDTIAQMGRTLAVLMQAPAARPLPLVPLSTLLYGEKRY